MKNIHKKMMTLKTQIRDLETEQNAIIDRTGELFCGEDEKLYGDLDSQISDLKTKQQTLETAAANGQDLMDDLKTFRRVTQPDQIGGRIPAQPKRQTLTCFQDAKTARRFGLWLMANVVGVPGIKALAEREGVSFNAAMTEGNNVSAGYLVPDEYSREMIRLVEDRGVFRKNSRVVQMMSDRLLIPRRTGGTTTYFVGEGSAITASDMTLDQVSLVLKKIASIVSVSNELSSDALVQVFDMLAQDIAYGFADQEDECGFNGDGTATYGGIVGVRQALIEAALGGDETGAVPAASGLVRYGTGSGYANIGMDDLTAMIGKLPQYAEANASWFMSKLVFSFLLDLMSDAGGNTIGTLNAGSEMRFLGYPVQISDVMPKASAINQVCILLGDLQKATTMAVSGSVRMEQSNSAVVGSTSMFENDMSAIRGVERFDIVAHDCGSTAAVGPLVGLISHTA